MKDILEGLNLIKSRLAEMDKFTEAKICNDLIRILKGEDILNVSNNRGQINISGGNSTIKAKQRTVINNSPVTLGDCNNQTINYSNWDDD